MSSGSNESAPSHEILIFNLGVLASEMSWHFDQAAFALSSYHREQFLGLLVRMKSLSSQLLPADADSELWNYLRYVEDWLPILDSEQYHEDHWHSLQMAEGQCSGLTSEEWFYQDRLPHIEPFREKFERGFILKCLANMHDKRWLFEAGLLIDNVQHSPEVARHVFYFDGEPSTDNPDPSVSWPATGEPLNTIAEPGRRPALKCFLPGELPPPEGWQAKVEAYFRQLGRPSPSEYWLDISTPEEVVNATNRMIDAIRRTLRQKTENGPANSNEDETKKVVVVTSNQVASVLFLQTKSMTPHHRKWDEPVVTHAGQQLAEITEIPAQPISHFETQRKSLGFAEEKVHEIGHIQPDVGAEKLGDATDSGKKISSNNTTVRNDEPTIEEIEAARALFRAKPNMLRSHLMSELKIGSDKASLILDQMRKEGLSTSKKRKKPRPKHDHPPAT